MKLFVSPHNDDAALFGAFTLQRERPTVLTIFDSFLQASRGHPECNASARREEDLRAMTVLGCPFVSGCVPDHLAREAASEAVERALGVWFGPVTEVWLPAVEIGGHEQHNLVGAIGLEVFAAAKVHRYLTYTPAWGKSTAGVEVSCTGAMVRRKLIALACYKTQIEIDALGCWPHFLGDQREYLAEAKKVKLEC
jgi:hypothetical protein